MNVLVITREIPPVGGGAGHVALNLAQCIAAAGHSITIITMHYGDLPKYENKGSIQLYRIWCARRYQDSSYYREMLIFLVEAWRLARMLQHQQPFHLVHAHAIFPDGLVAAGLGIPVIVTAHGSDVPGYNPDKFAIGHKLIKPLWHYVLDRTSSLVAPSQAHASLVRQQRPQQAITVIANGIDISSLAPKAKNRSFLICSRLVRRKNYQLFLAALQRLAAPQVVHIVGDGPMTKELMTLSEACRHHTIEFHGWQANGSPLWKDLYESGRFFVFPSEWENFPINLLEAQLAGMVVLASDIPGNREVLGENAEYFPSLSAEGVEQTVKNVLGRSDEELDNIGRSARQRVIDNLSWDTISKQYLSIYEKIQC